MVAAGLCAGAILSRILGRQLETFLFRTPVSDPYAVIGAFVVVAAATVGAAIGPARRALRIDPATGLRQD